MKKAKLFLLMAMVLVLSLVVVGAASAQTLPPPPPGAPPASATGGSFTPVTETPDGDPIPPAQMGFQALSEPFLVGVPAGSTVQVCIPIPEGFRRAPLMFLGGDGQWHTLPTTISGGMACGNLSVTSIVQLQGF